MNPILETSRCYLRELSVDDALHFYELNSDPEVIQYTGDQAFESIETARQFLENYNPYSTSGYGRWAVIDKKNNGGLTKFENKKFTVYDSKNFPLDNATNFIETPYGDAIAIRHKMFLSHSYDHRVVDGSLGGSFVKRVSDY